MSSKQWTKRWMPAAMLTGWALAIPAFGADAGRIYPGVTKPSESRDVTFNGPGVVAKLSVKEGDAVQAAQDVIDQDDTVEQKSLAAALVEATSNVQVDAAQAKLDYAQAEYESKLKLYKENAIADSELKEAKLDAIMAQKQVELAAQEKEQKALEAEEDQAKINLKHLLSPIGGIVLKINTHPGEAPAQDKPVMTIVKNDPLYVETDLPTADVKQLKLGQSMNIRYNGENDWLAAKVIFIAPEADARSDTQKVRMQMPNPSQRDSGLQVDVKLPDTSASADAK